ncbi:AIR synthase-related protein, partial [Arthrospira platensis SPKY1]|nr:AIR synthase-related protein [Arthrospira platensis SPKY1]
EAGCSLAGGHTAEGAELALGFSVQGLVAEGQILRQSGLQAGDCLILTKPLGTGTLLVAQARGRALGRWIDAALALMQQSAAAAMPILRQHGVRAATDVTGFGLAGHLLALLRAS